MAGKNVYISDPFAYRWLVANRELRDEDLRRMIAHHEFTSIVIDRGVEDEETTADRWPGDIRQTIRQNYQRKGQFTCNDARFVYEQKLSLSRLTSDDIGTK